MKLCKDCKHSALIRGEYYCAAIGVSKVNGMPDKMCETERERGNECGRDGKLFEGVEKWPLRAAIIALLIPVMLLLLLVGRLT